MNKDKWKAHNELLQQAYRFYLLVKWYRFCIRKVYWHD